MMVWGQENQRPCPHTIHQGQRGDVDQARTPAAAAASHHSAQPTFLFMGCDLDKGIPTMTSIAGVDPRTGTALPAVAEATSTNQVDAIVSAAAGATAELDLWGRHARAGMLDTMAEHIEDARRDLVATAESETGFTTVKLDAELTRSVYQLRFFGQVIRDGAYLEATIDPA